MIDCLTQQSLTYLRQNDSAKALQVAQRALALLEQIPQVEHLRAIYFVQYEVFVANGWHKEAQEYLQKAYQEVMKTAHSINDINMRELFLKVKLNKDIIDRWERVYQR